MTMSNSMTKTSYCSLFPNSHHSSNLLSNQIYAVLLVYTSSAALHKFQAAPNHNYIQAWPFAWNALYEYSWINFATMKFSEDNTICSDAMYQRDCQCTWNGHEGRKSFSLFIVNQNTANLSICKPWTCSDYEQPLQCVYTVAGEVRLLNKCLMVLFGLRAVR